MKIIAIDPGPKTSAWLIWDYDKKSIHDIGNAKEENQSMLCIIKNRDIDYFAIEMVACYGMAVGADIFETVFWIGRFWEAASSHCPIMKKVYRKDVKIHLCGSMKAKDTNIRQALIDKHGAPGTKAAPGKLYGVKTHLWAALAVADYVLTEGLNDK